MHCMDLIGCKRYTAKIKGMASIHACALSRDIIFGEHWRTATLCAGMTPASHASDKTMELYRHMGRVGHFYVLVLMQTPTFRFASSNPDG